MKTSSYLIAGLLLAAQQASAFCGFYVGKADSSLFNEASQVAIVRDGDKTVLSMLNDYKGDLKEFALVVPVPTVLTRSQINVGDPKIFARLDAYSAPRLAEYFDPNPCMDRRMMRMDTMTMRTPSAAPAPAAAKTLGVTVEAQYTIGEYDIVILSAKDSDGLETWLTQSGYKIPAGASKALRPYINQGLKFFVAKVNLKEQSKTGFTMLRPLQFAFESERFMLPLRLGMANAVPNKPQDLIVYALTKKGRVESSNYRTQMMPANMDLPPLIKNDFKRFYKTMFDEQTKREGYKSVFTEYFWDMGWCDPCAADPISTDELKKAGVFWLAKPEVSSDQTPVMPLPPQPQGGVRPQPRIMPPTMGGGAQPVMLTRLHIRYTAETFPEDLMLTETADRNNYQTRYVMRHPWKGNPPECTAEGAGGNGKDQLLSYLKDVQQRQEKELNTLLSLTNWDAADTRAKSDIAATQKRYADAVAFYKAKEANQPKTNWWDGLWSK
jgi:hypothetical protein